MLPLRQLSLPGGNGRLTVMQLPQQHVGALAWLEHSVCGPRHLDALRCAYVGRSCRDASHSVVVASLPWCCCHRPPMRNKPACRRSARTNPARSASLTASICPAGCRNAIGLASPARGNLVNSVPRRAHSDRTLGSRGRGRRWSVRREG